MPRGPPPSPPAAQSRPARGHPVPIPPSRAGRISPPRRPRPCRRLRRRGGRAHTCGSARPPGAYMASAALNRPNRNGPPVPCRLRQSCQMATMRRTSAATGLSRRALGLCARKFMGQCSRRAWKPACISAETLRARARAAAALGHSDGWVSARCSMMARLSQTTRPPPTSSAGTLPEGEHSRICALASGARKSMSISSKAMPAWRMASQGRRLQLDAFLLPITNFIGHATPECPPGRAQNYRDSPRLARCRHVWFQHPCCFTAVGRASSRPPRLIDLSWGRPNAPKVTLVGKGILSTPGASTSRRRAAC